MSRIGKQPVLIPDKVKVTVSSGTVLVEGPKGKVQRTFAPAVKVEVADKKVTFAPTEQTRFANAMYGTARSVVAGAVVAADENTLQLQLETKEMREFKQQEVERIVFSDSLAKGDDPADTEAACTNGALLTGRLTAWLMLGSCADHVTSAIITDMTATRMTIPVISEMRRPRNSRTWPIKSANSG